MQVWFVSTEHGCVHALCRLVFHVPKRCTAQKRSRGASRARAALRVAAALGNGRGAGRFRQLSGRAASGHALEGTLFAPRGGGSASRRRLLNLVSQNESLVYCGS